MEDMIVWVITEHEPNSEFPVIVIGVFRQQSDARKCVSDHELERIKHADIWWECCEFKVM